MKWWKISLFIIFVFILVACRQAGDEVVEDIEPTATLEPTATIEPTVIVPTKVCESLAFDEIMIFNLATSEGNNLYKYEKNNLEKISGDLYILGLIGFLESTQEIIGYDKEMITYAIDVDGDFIRQISYEGINYQFPEISPDEKSIIYSFYTYTESILNTELFMFDLEKKENKRITNTEYNEDFPDWDPSGVHIVYVKQDGGFESLETINIETGEINTISEMQSVRMFNPKWSSDGRYIAYKISDMNLRNTDIVIYDTLLEKTDNLTSNLDLEEYHFQWSPDNKSLAISTEGGTTSIYIISINNKEVEPVYEIDSAIYLAYWVNDGKHLTFVVRPDGIDMGDQFFIKGFDNCEPNQIIYLEDDILELILIED